MERPLYINWLVNEEGVTFEDGVALKCYKLSYETDEAVFDDWALHIRKHYVEDDELTDDSVATGLSIEDYLRKYIVPQKQEELGPTARSNDISEILFADLFRFLYKGIIIKHNKTEPTYTKTSLFLCEKRRFFMARTEKGVVTTI